MYEKIIDVSASLLKLIIRSYMKKTCIRTAHNYLTLTLLILMIRIKASQISELRVQARWHQLSQRNFLHGQSATADLKPYPLLIEPT